MAVTMAIAARQAAVNAVDALCNSGTIQFQTSGDVEVATCTFGATAFGNANGSGVAQANAITQDASATGGTVAKARFYKSDAITEVLACSCTGTGGGGDIELSSLVVAASDTVSVTALSVTQPA